MAWLQGVGVPGWSETAWRLGDWRAVGKAGLTHRQGLMRSQNTLLGEEGIKLEPLSRYSHQGYAGKEVKWRAGSEEMTDKMRHLWGLKTWNWHWERPGHETEIRMLE